MRPLEDAPTRRWSPAEGWLTLWAGLAMLGLLGMVIDRGRSDGGTQLLAATAAAGYLAGFALAKLRIPDLLAHLISSMAGIIVAIVSVDAHQTWDLLRGRQIITLVERNADRVEVIVRSIDSGERLPDDAARLAIALTIWLVGYSSAWMLFRRGWFVWSVLLSAAIFLTTLSLERDQPSWPALLFAALAIVQGARFTTYTHRGMWQRRGLSSPLGLGRWSSIAGAVLSGLVIVAGVAAPLTVPDDTRSWVVARSHSLAGTVGDQLDRFSPSEGRSSLSGDYGEFSDQFRIGEGVPDSDAEIALLRAAGPSYLAARKYDIYDGRGWSSSFDAAESARGVNISAQPPRIAFSADQEMNLPGYVFATHAERAGVITLFRPGSGLMLTIETHASASVPTAVRVGWQTIDEAYLIEQTGLLDVPVDLRSLVGMLSLAEYEVTDESSGTVTLLDAAMRQAVQAERQNLLERYPLETTIAFDQDQGLVLRASGRLPVYEDVEGVFYSGSGSQSTTYSVVGLTPAVAGYDLARAGTDYPDYVESRYLQLPDSVTQRTRDLAAQIVDEAGATNPFDIAMAIQEYLRLNYQYLLESNLAPGNQDIVDYFLFDRQVGRCDHFASSMTVLLRSLGIPSRIVSGLAPVTFDDAAAGYLYRARDAHAWVEVYFPEYGWVQFEPTPSQTAPDFTAAPEPRQEPSGQLPEPTPTPIPEESEPEPSPEASPVAAVVTETPEASGGFLQRSTSFPGLIMIALLALCVAVLIGRVVWIWPLRGMKPGAAYFARFQRLAGIFGIDHDQTTTPAEYADRYGSANPRYARAAQIVTDAYVDERYGPDGRSSDVAQRGLAGWRELRRAAVDWRPWRRRSS